MNMIFLLYKTITMSDSKHVKLPQNVANFGINIYRIIYDSEGSISYVINNLHQLCFDRGLVDDCRVDGSDIKFVKKYVNGQPIFCESGDFDCLSITYWLYRINNYLCCVRLIDKVFTVDIMYIEKIDYDTCNVRGIFNRYIKGNNIAVTRFSKGGYFTTNHWSLSTHDESCVLRASPK
jgi:hypothetical protein